MKRKLILLLVVIIYSGLNLNSQIIEPVKWKFSTKQLSDDEVMLNAVATIDATWHLYGQYFGEGGPVRMVFTFEESPNYKKIGKVEEWPKPHEEMDEIFEIKVQFFDGKATFSQKIKVLTDKDFTIKGSLEGQACSTVDGQCVFSETDFEFKVKGAKNLTESVEDQVEEKDSGIAVLDTNISEQVDTTSAMVSDTVGEITTGTDNKAKKDNWLIVFIIAFVAGLLSLLTPCVFPMIPLTISFFMKGDKSKSKGMKQAYFFGFSIILIFAVLGLILTLIFGKDAMYVISTHWIPNMIFFVIFMVFALSFFGLFEITIPHRLVSKSDQQADKGGLMGIFFVAFTTVLVSFSCTGPILGAALIELSSGSENSMVFFISMIGFALGFALPFTLLAMFPSVLKKLKSGSWLNSVKIIFGFLEIALGLKFLSMADLGANWGILDRETFLAIWIVTFALLGFYFLGKLKFKGDNDLPHIGVPRLFMAIITFSFVVYMIPGLWGAPLKTLSGYLPPQTTQDFDLERMIVENRGTVAPYEFEDLGEIKYSDKLHLPTGFHGFFDLEQAKAFAKKVNKPIFVDFTGKTCANCREMENNVWNDPAVKKLLNEEFVMVALYADANFIKLDEKDWFTTEEGKVIKKLGQKNLNYQITRFNMNAQPYYVLMDYEENVLTKENKAYEKEVKNFVSFLKEGLANYNKKHK